MTFARPRGVHSGVALLVAGSVAIARARRYNAAAKRIPSGWCERVTMLRRIGQRLAKLWYRLVTLKSSPRKIALGFAVGVFLSYTPTFGFQTVLALSVATLLRVNPIATVVGTYVTNFFTVGPIYLLCYQLGRFVLGMQSGGNAEMTQTDAGWSILRLGKAGLGWIGLEMLGAAIVGVITAVPAYFLSLFGVIRYRTARLNRRIKKMRRRLQQADTSTASSPPSTAHGHSRGETADGTEDH